MSIQIIAIPSAERDRCLNRHIPYRIAMLDGPDLWVRTGGRNSPLEPVFPSIFESALITCRWTGNFLGLTAYPDHPRAVAMGKRPKPTDIFSIDLGGTLVELDSLSKSESELLARVLVGADVATAHP